MSADYESKLQNLAYESMSISHLERSGLNVLLQCYLATG